MSGRAWGRALWLAPIVIQLFCVQTAIAASPPISRTAAMAARSGYTGPTATPTPTPNGAPDQSHPVITPIAGSPSSSSRQGGPTTAPVTPLAPSNGLRREVFGFGTADSLGDPTVGYPIWNFNLLSTVAFFSINVQYNGVLVADANWTVWDSSILTGLVNTAHAHGVKVVVTITPPHNITDFCDALYNDQTTVAQIVNQVVAKGIDGVNIDYEGQLVTCENNDPTKDASSQALFTNLAKDMRAALDAARPGYYLSVDTYSGSALGNDGFFNIPDLNLYVDSFFVMAYDMDYANQPYAPLGCSSFCMAPVSPLANYYWNDTASMSQYSAVVGPGKTILGLPYYGRVACVSQPVAHAAATRNLTGATYMEAAAVAGSPDVQPGTFAGHRDANDASGMDRWDTWYDNKLSCWREMHWSDAATLGVRYNLVNQMNLRGTGFWTLNYGGGSPELWSTLGTYFKACYSVGGTVNPAPPVLSGTSVTVIAAASCPDSNPLYQFSILAPGASSYRIVQPYSTSPTWNWDTTAMAPGTYQFSIWARDAYSTGLYGNGSGTWDTYNNNLLYRVTSLPCSAVKASATPASPVAIGSSVTVNASASGCPNPRYQFMVLGPGSSGYQVVQAYSTNRTYSWTTTGGAPGTYRFSVWARDGTSWGTYGNSTGRWDAFDSRTLYTVTSCSALSLSVSHPSPAGIGTAITLTARATGCPDPNPLYLFAFLAPGSSTFQVAQAYSTSPTFSWNTTGTVPGAYRFSVWVRDVNSGGAGSNASGSWDVYDNKTLFTLSTCSSLNVSVSPRSPSPAGTNVTVTASASGCPNPSPRYQFSVLAPGTTTYQVVQAYSAGRTFAWNTTGLAPGAYRFSIWVRDANSGGAAGNSTGRWDLYNNSTVYSLS